MIYAVIISRTAEKQLRKVPLHIAEKLRIWVEGVEEEGLENMRRMGKKLGLPVEVYGPETHMTRIVSMALKGGK